MTASKKLGALIIRSQHRSVQRDGAWRSTVGGVMQAPTFNSKGAADAFGAAVAAGRRKAEPETAAQRKGD